MTTQPDPKLLARLSRIEGQVRGIGRMLEDGRYCIDILNQIQAAKAALSKIEDQVLKDHADTCVQQAIRGGSAREQRQKFAELVELFRRYTR